ncbi:MAG: hypothetical protein Tsb0015_15600 [Simkaniaceae bacterium]
MKIWKRMILSDLLKSAIFILFSFFFVYVLMDISTHFNEIIKDANSSISTIVKYYSFHLSKRLDFLLPFSLLISILKCLNSMRGHHELVALQMAGISNKRLLAPFFQVSMISLFLLILNFEFIYPQATNFIEAFELSHLKNPSAKHKKTAANAPLSVMKFHENQKIVYTKFEPQNNILKDVFYVMASDHVFHMKSLQIIPAPTGHFVSHFIKNEKNQWELKDSYPQKTFDFPGFLQNASDFLPWDARSLSSLCRLSFSSQSYFQENSEKIHSYLFFKSIKILFPMLVLIASAPFTFSYRRGRNDLPVYSLAIFGYIAFYVIAGALHILGEGGIVFPCLILLLPIMIFSIIFLPRFLKI